MKDISREFTLELVRVTEAAALKASQWVGKGNKEAADQAAVDAMRGMLELINIQGTVVIGEGEKDKAPMLYIGEKVGGGGRNSPVVDIAVDPLDGTELTSQGKPNAVAVLAAGNKGTLMSFPSFYVDKIAVGPKAKGCIDINDKVESNLKRVARAYNSRVEDVTAIILDRPRHQEIISRIRKLGARIRLLRAGDVAGAIATAMPNSEVDILFGVGGAPEGVLAAAALKCMGGEIQVKMYAKDEEEKKKILDLGYKEKDFNKVYTTDDLVKGDSIIFSATGVTGGYFLPAVRYKGNMAITNSVVMRAKTGTVRYIKAYHNLDIKTIPSRREAKEIGI